MLAISPDCQRILRALVNVRVLAMFERLRRGALGLESCPLSVLVVLTSCPTTLYQ